MKEDQLSDLLGLLSDRKSRELLNTMVEPGFNTITLRKKSKMTRKQIYSRTCKMLKIGLISRSKGKLSVTFFGKVILQNLQYIQQQFTNLILHILTTSEHEIIDTCRSKPTQNVCTLVRLVYPIHKICTRYTFKNIWHFMV